MLKAAYHGIIIVIIPVLTINPANAAIDTDAATVLSQRFLRFSERDMRNAACAAFLINSNKAVRSMRMAMAAHAHASVEDAATVMMGALSHNETWSDRMAANRPIMMHV
jgi:hypothetical protein